MKTYIVELNKLEKNPIVCEVIKGKTAAEALHNRFLLPFKKIGGKEAEKADITIVKGYIRENGTIKYQGRATRMYFVVDKEAI